MPRIVIRKYNTLYQHTPLIHFQGEQAGATLRASQVKPQLDRYLIAAGGGEKAIPEGWWAKPADQKSLNFRLKIVPGKATKLSGGAKLYSNYFGDERKVTFHPILQLNVDVPDPNLGVHIRSHLSEFFYQTNFGTRASKGFGSFSLGQEIKKNYVFKFAVADSGTGERNFQNLFRHIEFFHRSLRTGLNCFMDPEGLNVYPNPNPSKNYPSSNNQSLYMKPHIFSYAAQKDLVWEKKAVKEKTLSIWKNKQKPERPAQGHPWPAWFPENESAQQELTRATVRDVFGLSTDQSWMAYKFKVAKKPVANAEQNSSNQIERAPSPFTFVPVKLAQGFAVYVYARQPDEVYLNQRIEVVVEDKNRGNTAIGKLQVFPNFKMDDFLNEYLDPKEVAKAILTKDKNTEVQEQNEYLRDLLLEMYTQAKASLKLHNIQQA